METKVTKEEEGFFALDKRGKIILESVIEQINTLVISDVDVVIPDGSIINNDAHHAEPYATGVDIAKGTLNLSGNIAINNASGAAGLYTNDKVVKVTGSLTGENAITVACNIDGTVIAQGDGYTPKLEGNLIVCVVE